MKKNESVIIFTAKLLGGVALVMFVYFILRNFPDLKGLFSNSLRSMLLLCGFAAAGYLFSFYQRKEGGLVMTLSGVILGLTVWYQSFSGFMFIPAVMAFFFLVSGLIFWRMGSSGGEN